jgi:hypothetical protein
MGGSVKQKTVFEKQLDQHKGKWGCQEGRCGSIW